MHEPTLSAFATLGLNEVLARTLAELGYEVPTPIQERTIPPLLAGKDLVGQAQTGTGKTAAFALPILQRLDPKRRSVQALVLTPTRELAMQVAEAFHTYGRGIQPPIHVLPVYGGAPMGAQLRSLERGVQVVVGTPGRLIDHLDRRTLDLSGVETIVLDEADEMLKMGFIEDVERILTSAAERKQTALFSATMPREVVRIAERHLRDPERVEIEHREMTAPAIEQRFVNVAEGQKLDVLTRMLELDGEEAALIFRRTRTGAAELAERLEARGFAAVAMHGEMNQAMREAVIRRLKKGEVDVVVATDVAARGLDVERIGHVVNYDVPNDVEAYVHRIGRTGRAGRAGTATLFVTPRERRMMREIEKYTGSTIRPMKIPTHADVAAKRVESLKDTIRKELAGEGGLELYLAVVEQLSEEGPFDVADVAAAALRMASRERPIEPTRPETIFEPPLESRRGAPPQRGGGVSRRGGGVSPLTGRVGESRGPARDDREPKARLTIGVGTADGIRPADVVGSIANEAGIAGREIGPIEIAENETTVGVPLRHRDRVIEAMRGAKFKGRSMSLRVAGGAPAGPAGPRQRTEYERPQRPQRPEHKRPSRARPTTPRRREDRPAPRESGPPAKKGFYSGIAKPGGKKGKGGKPYGKKKGR